MNDFIETNSVSGNLFLYVFWVRTPIVLPSESEAIFENYLYEMMIVKGLKDMSNLTFGLISMHWHDKGR